MDALPQFSQIALKIIKAQELIIGSLAWDQANRANGLIIDRSRTLITFSGDEKETINRLVMQYVKVFGKVSQEVSKKAVRDLISQMPEDQIPSIFNKDLKLSESQKISEKLYEQNLETSMKLEKTRENLKIEKITNKKSEQLIRDIERELRR